MVQSSSTVAMVDLTSTTREKYRIPNSLAVREILQTHTNPTDIGLEVGPGLFGIVDEITSEYKERIVQMEASREVAQENRRLARNRIDRDVCFFVGDVYQMPFADNSFDYVIARNVFDILPDLETALLEVKRVLKPRGKLFHLNDLLTDARVLFLDDRIRDQRKIFFPIWKEEDKHTPSYVSIVDKETLLKSLYQFDPDEADTLRLYIRMQEQGYIVCCLNKELGLEFTETVSRFPFRVETFRTRDIIMQDLGTAFECAGFNVPENRLYSFIANLQREDLPENSNPEHNSFTNDTGRRSEGFDPKIGTLESGNVMMQSNIVITVGVSKKLPPVIYLPADLTKQ